MPPGTYTARPVQPVVGSVVQLSSGTTTAARAPMRTHFGIKAVEGVPASIKPIIGCPPGRRRLKFRNDSVARLFVRDEHGIREFWLRDNGDTWSIGAERARNFLPLTSDL